MYQIHNTRYSMGLQQYPNQGRGWMERGIPHPRRTVRTHSNVLRTHKLPHHLSNHDECYLPKQSGGGVVIGIYGRHGYTYSQTTTWNWRTTYPMTPYLRPQSLDQARRKRSLSQTREMWVWKRRDRIPQSHCRKKPSQDEPKETSRHGRLANTQNTNRCTMILGLHWLLPLLRTKLFVYSQTTPGSHEENYPLALGRTTIQGIRRTKNLNVLQSSPSPTKLWQTVYPTSRRISLWHGRHTLTGGWPLNAYSITKTKNQTNAPSSSILFSYLHGHRTKLRHIRTRTPCHHESLSTLETILRVDQDPIRHKNRPCESPILEISKKPKSTNG